MSILQRFTVRCDHPDCTEAVHSTVGAYPDRGPMADLVNDVEGLGWLSIPPDDDGPFWSRCRHFCPAHADAARARHTRQNRKKRAAN